MLFYFVILNSFLVTGKSQYQCGLLPKDLKNTDASFQDSKRLAIFEVLQIVAKNYDVSIYAK